MSGDNAPGEIVRGAQMAAEQCGVDILLVGDKPRIERIMAEGKLPTDRITIEHCDRIITMEDEPLSIIKDNRTSSMGVCFTLLHAGEGDALVCAGNSGALLAGATLIIKRITNIKRAAIGAILPFQRTALLIDAGANVDETPDYLQQYAVMGSTYMKYCYDIAAPEIGLANNGTEESKGDELHSAAYTLLKANPHINFIGNIEGRGIPIGICDVVVSDGFTGNMILKVCEGFGVMLSSAMKQLFMKNILTQLSAATMKTGIEALKHSYDSTEHGGAPLLGISRPVIKAHGSSNAKALMNAIRQAVKYVDSGIIGKIEHLTGQ